MSIINKTDDELWQLYQDLQEFPKGVVVGNARQDILQEIIRREKEQIV